MMAIIKKFKVDSLGKGKIHHNKAGICKLISRCKKPFCFVFESQKSNKVGKELKEEIEIL